MSIRLQLGSRSDREPIFPSWSGNRSVIAFQLIFPFLLALPFVVWAREQIEFRGGMIGGHLVVVFLWAVLTMALSAVVSRLAGLVLPSWADRVAALVPAASFYVLTVAYAAAVIGIANWGEPMTWAILRRALPDVFWFAQSLSLPRFVPIVILGVPPVLFLGVFQLVRIRWSTASAKAAGAGPNSAGRVRWLLRAAVGILVVGIVWLPEEFGLGPGAPIVGFFGERLGGVEMTPSREREAVRALVARTAIGQQTPRVRNIVLFVVDALRPDRLSLYGYDRVTDPFLRTLATRLPFHRFETVLSVSNESRGGILAILNGRSYATLSDLNYSLSDYLVDTGFSSTMILAGDHNWYGLKRGYGRTIHRYVQGSDAPGPNGTCDDELLMQAAERLPVSDGKRHFFFFHLMSVHDLGYLQPRFREAQPATDPHQPSREALRAEGIGHVIAADYDRRVLQADDMIRRLVETLTGKGYGDDTLFVVTADHGQLLGERGLFGHLHGMSRAELQIPWLVFSTKPLEGIKTSNFATQLDIAPTIADLAGLEVPVSWQGRSLCQDSTAPWSFHECTFPFKKREVAVVYRTESQAYKYSYQLLQPGDRSKQRLYELVGDPDEEHDLIDSAELDGQLREEIRRRGLANFNPAEVR